MATQSKLYITASELAELLGISVGHAYKINKKRFCNEKGSGEMVKKFPDDEIIGLQYEV